MGTRIYNKLCELIRAEYRVRGFEEVTTPNIYKKDLFETSGHIQNYADDMYGLRDVEGEQWFMKPMNCPGHCMVFQSRPRVSRNQSKSFR
jgi:threonyl-tRNA synthetase